MEPELTGDNFLLQFLAPSFPVDSFDWLTDRKHVNTFLPLQSLIKTCQRAQLGRQALTPPDTLHNLNSLKQEI